jgi:branched-chain amino acid transport system permease protein
MHITIISIINACLALSLNLIILTGHVSLAHGAFFGIGAYTSTLIVMRLGASFWLALPIAALIAAIVSFLLGLLTLKLKGIYFALATFAFNEICRMLFIGWVSLFGGPGGIPRIPPPPSIDLFGVVNLNFDSKFDYFYIVAVLLIITLFISVQLYKSKTRLFFIAIEEGELLTSCLGIDTMKFKIFAFMLGSIIAGIAGSTYAHYFNFISPQDFSFWTSVDALVFTVVGGVGTIAGPILGSIVLTVIPEVLRFAVEYQTLLYGLVLILALLFMPRGIMGIFQKIGNRIRTRGTDIKNGNIKN